MWCVVCFMLLLDYRPASSREIPAKARASRRHNSARHVGAFGLYVGSFHPAHCLLGRETETTSVLRTRAAAANVVLTGKADTRTTGILLAVCACLCHSLHGNTPPLLMMRKKKWRTVSWGVFSRRTRLSTAWSCAQSARSGYGSGTINDRRHQRPLSLCRLPLAPLP